jgi:hypothetical protein
VPASDPRCPSARNPDAWALTRGLLVRRSAGATRLLRQQGGPEIGDVRSRNRARSGTSGARCRARIAASAASRSHRGCETPSVWVIDSTQLTLCLWLGQRRPSPADSGLAASASAWPYWLRLIALVVSTDLALLLFARRSARTSGVRVIPACPPRFPFRHRFQRTRPGRFQ